MPTELDQPQLDPRQEEAYKTYQQRKAEWDALVAQGVERPKPSLWRTLAAVGAGAAGGWNFDRGGMQWGQQLAREITEGPYQRRMNDHLRQLAEKRQGLDVAQEGLNVMDRAANFKQLAAQRKREGEDRTTREAEKLEAQRLKGEGIYKVRLNGQSGGDMLEYVNRNEAMADPSVQAKLKAGTHTLHEPSAGHAVFLTPTQETLTKRKVEEVGPLAQRINAVISANPGLSKRGFIPVDMQTATSKGITGLENYFKEINDVLNLEMQVRGRAANRGGGGEDPDTKHKWQEHNQVWSSSRRDVAALTRQATALQQRIATTQDPTTKTELSRVLDEVQQNIAERLNSAYTEDPLMTPEKMKQYEVVGGSLKERGAAAQPKPNQPQVNKPVGPPTKDPLGVL